MKGSHFFSARRSKAGIALSVLTAYLPFYNYPRDRTDALAVRLWDRQQFHRFELLRHIIYSRASPVLVSNSNGNLLPKTLRTIQGSAEKSTDAALVALRCVALPRPTSSTTTMKRKSLEPLLTLLCQASGPNSCLRNPRGLLFLFPVCFHTFCTLPPTSGRTSSIPACGQIGLAKEKNTRGGTRVGAHQSGFLRARREFERQRRGNSTPCLSSLETPAPEIPARTALRVLPIGVGQPLRALCRTGRKPAEVLAPEILWISLHSIVLVKTSSAA